MQVTRTEVRKITATGGWGAGRSDWVKMSIFAVLMPERQTLNFLAAWGKRGSMLKPS